jgi:hypothetical protein
MSSTVRSLPLLTFLFLLLSSAFASESDHKVKLLSPFL